MRNTGLIFTNRFSFPINVHEIITNKRIDIEWFKKHASVINEVYVSPDFLGLSTKDMNGANIIAKQDDLLELLMDIKACDIKICVIFNDVFEDEDSNMLTLQLFGNKLKYYQDLIDIVVVPNKSWLSLRDDYPHLEIKNTVINLPTFEEIERGDYDDYDCIYIHDEIIHNHDLYKSIKGNRRFGTVVNYSDCSTNCQLKLEHYRLVKKEKYDANLFCKTVKYSPVELLLKRNSIPGWLSEFEYYADVIDIYKLQGRNTTGTFESAIEIVEKVHAKYYEALSEYELLEREVPKLSLIKWKREVRNCGGDCDNCSYCDNILREIQ